jgi:hypothetical protein
MEADIFAVIAAGNIIAATVYANRSNVAKTVLHIGLAMIVLWVAP